MEEHPLVKFNRERDLWLMEMDEEGDPTSNVFFIPQGWCDAFTVASGHASGPDNTDEEIGPELYCYAPTREYDNSPVAKMFVSLDVLKHMPEMTEDEAHSLHPKLKQYLTFADYIQRQDDHIRRYVAYLANELNESLEEAASRSLSRVWQQMNDSQNHAILTAFYGEREPQASREVNAALAADMRERGWGFIPVLGSFCEKVRDPVTPQGTDEEISEEFYFVTDSGDRHLFRKEVLKLLHKYQPDSAVVAYGADELAYLLNEDGSEESLGKWAADQLGRYYSKMIKCSPNTMTTFEAAGDLTKSTLMAMDMMFFD